MATEADVKTGWQPIETSPEDGPVLLWPDEYGNIVIADQRQTNGQWWIGDWDYPVPATHWMPLPDPPGPEKCCEGGPQWGHALGCPKCPD